MKPKSYRTPNIGLKPCGRHNSDSEIRWRTTEHTIDITCMHCIRWPKRKSDAQYVADLRRWAGVARKVTHVTVGEQLSFEGIAV